MRVGCPRVRQLVIKRVCLWERKLARGKQEETIKGSKHVSASGRRVCVQNTRDQGMDIAPSSLQPALTLSFSILKSLLGSSTFIALHRHRGE